MNDNELMHYGVMGMKWGVRHNPSRAFGQSVKKAKKLNNKIAKAEVKLNKATLKRDKVAKRYSGIGIASRGDLAGATQKHYKATKKLAKAKAKSQKWEANMKKNFKNIKAKDINPETRSAGRDYIDMLLKD